MVAQLLIDTDMIGLAVALVGVILLGIAALVWSKKQLQPPPDPRLTLQDELESYRKLVHQGLLRPEEFEEIRARLDRVRRPPSAPME